jgi:hypothetical protein
LDGDVLPARVGEDVEVGQKYSVPLITPVSVYEGL